MFPFTGRLVGDARYASSDQNYPFTITVTGQTPVQNQYLQFMYSQTGLGMDGNDLTLMVCMTLIISRCFVFVKGHITALVSAFVCLSLCNEIFCKIT